MTTIETRLGRLEAWRESHAADIKDIKSDIKSMDGKLDTLVAAKGAASWLTRGLMPALWGLIMSGAGALAAIKIGH